MRTIDKINYYLTKENKNGADLCEYLGVSSGVYSQWNTGRTHPRKSKLPIIAEYLGVEVSDIQGDDTNKKEKPTAQGGELISDLPENIQELISICLQNPDFTVSLLMFSACSAAVYFFVCICSSYHCHSGQNQLENHKLHYDTQPDGQKYQQQHANGVSVGCFDVVHFAAQKIFVNHVLHPFKVAAMIKSSIVSPNHTHAAV